MLGQKHRGQTYVGPGSYPKDHEGGMFAITDEINTNTTKGLLHTFPSFVTRNHRAQQRTMSLRNARQDQ